MVTMLDDARVRELRSAWDGLHYLTKGNFGNSFDTFLAYEEARVSGRREVLGAPAINPTNPVFRTQVSEEGPSVSEQQLDQMRQYMGVQSFPTPGILTTEDCLADSRVKDIKPETNLMLGPESLEPFFNTPLLLAPDRVEGLTTALREQRSDALVNGRAGARATVSVSAPVAVLPILGMLDKRPSQFLSVIGGTATDTIREQFDAALADPSIHTIVFDVDSPGGPMSGAFELSDAIFSARSRKRILAVVNEEMNSGAYLIASAASEVVTPEGGRLGSIGVIASHTDARQSERMAGLHVTVFRAGEFKAKPSMHEGVDDRTRAEIERQLSDVMGMFIDKVARNRNLSREHVRTKIATGQVWFGRDAVSLGLADRIGTLADVLKRAA